MHLVIFSSLVATKAEKVASAEAKASSIDKNVVLDGVGCSQMDVSAYTVALENTSDTHSASLIDKLCAQSSPLFLKH